ncbi:MAG: RluA family pseudouridine synthase [Bacteroidota bacterium]
MTEDIDQNKSEEQDELFEHHRIIVDKGQGLLRIDKFLTLRLENTSRNKVQSAADAGNILVNDKPVKPNYRVKPCDVISVVLAYPPREIELIPENIPIDIVYEDEDIIIINKKPGIVVHPAYGNYTGTLVNAVLFHFNQLPHAKDSDIRPGLVHRIDKDTSGIMVMAKNEFSMAKMSKKFFDRNIDRKYVALVWGDFEEENGTITGNIGRSLKDRKIMGVFPDGELGKHAVTHYKVIEHLRYVSLVECKLETGRTHQIRVHMKHIGHPIFNDKEYGGDIILKGTTFTKYKQFANNCFNILPRQALHAKSLGFEHPRTGEYMFFDSDLPEDMAMALDKWRNYTCEK